MYKRIISCLDIKDGRVVKGVNFVNIKDAGDPVELARIYSKEGADELVFLDISATNEGRKATIGVIEQVVQAIDIPLTVGGGIASTEDIERLIDIGVSKVAMSTAAVNNPELISEAASRFGSNKIVVAIDAKYREDWQDWEVVIHGGKKQTGLKTVEWAEQVASLGAGEIVLTSMETDGTKNGFDLALTRSVVEAVEIPVIASGGAGNHEHFLDLFTVADADAGLAASIFHFKEVSIGELKQYLQLNHVEVKRG